MANPLLALQVETPDIAGSFMAGQQQAQQNRTARLSNMIRQQEFAQQQDAQAKQNQLEQFYQQNGPALMGGDQQASQNALAKLSQFNAPEALKVQGTLAANQQAQIKQKSDQFNAAVQDLGGIMDAPPEAQAQLYAQMKQRHAQMGMDVSNLPPTWDSTWAKSALGSMVSAKDRFEAQNKDALQTERTREFNITSGETARANRAREGQAAAMLAETTRANQAKEGGSDQATVQSYGENILNGNAMLQNVPAKDRPAVSKYIADQTDATSPTGASRATMASARITEPFRKLPQYELTANGLPYLQRIDAAMKVPGSVSDQDLLDSLTKLNTAGNAISDAQVKIITDGKSWSDAIGTFANKFKNGGVLSDNQRQQIQSIAKEIYANYKKGYQPVYDQATAQLKAAGIKPQFWTIPDLNNLSEKSGIGGGSNSAQSATPGAPDIQSIVDELKKRGVVK